ncbi:3-deoxy-D-manno-octulosonate cytidylyltransferase [Candidatus Magnetobacterium bavaricum]|uniref:3-deoxy-D-manno-octulosonate cytidylyltransferase n=1 Tax=Candidatus Magnetobacterium bavaricum TaxID=29290 RepID=A0A0F3GNE8_9BACT|nr:3-deoxy-D-manno-octulosonate cytidylyltransferase [Candidatus Magnetobacterium bavaricum]
MTTVAIIPARYESSRFPGKPLALINGKPMVRHVYEGVSGAVSLNGVIVATDDARIRDVVEGFGGKVVMTSGEHSSGTDRIAEVAQGFGADIIVNVQGDEPMVRAEMIDQCVGLMDDERADMATLKILITNKNEIHDTNVVKVVTDAEGFALYFSRLPIPFCRDAVDVRYYKHIGIYVYRREVLLALRQRPQCMIETAESQTKMVGTSALEYLLSALKMSVFTSAVATRYTTINST